MHTDWPFAYGAPVATAHYRSQPEHFRVTEISTEQLSGIGDYLYLKITKRDIDTAAVLSELSKYFKIKPRAISYAGRKDKRAVTTQWFCIASQDIDLPPENEHIHPKFRVIETQRHDRKLDIGALVGNRFTIQLTEFEGDRHLFEDRLQQLSLEGFPNYFGAQRFGSKWQNLIRGQRMLSGKLRVKDRNQRSIYLSACRSYLFNEILARRISANTWHHPLSGEDSIDLRTELPPEWQIPSVSTISPLGYLPGDGEISVQGEAGEIMSSVLNAHNALYEGIRNSRVAWQTRPLRMLASDLVWKWQDNQLELAFSLPKGAFATSLLRELIVLD